MKPGIICAGNFIVDRLREVEVWPEEEMLAEILSESVSNGGGPYNVLKDLAAMEAPFLLEAAGCVGEDVEGQWIREDCRRAGIDTRQLHMVAGAPTSYTEVICSAATGRRTFFHRRGANALFGPEHVDFAASRAGHFHLAYLMLLDALDEEGEDGRTHAARLLEKARAAGLSTSADLVSVRRPRFVEKVASALPFIDYLFVNELEAEQATGIRIREDGGISMDAARSAARALVGGGVGRQVILHFSAGAVVCDASGGTMEGRAWEVPPEEIAGANGAGDAFAAGYLFGLQTGEESGGCLRMAFAAAAACLTHASPSGGLRPMAECLARGERIGKAVHS